MKTLVIINLFEEMKYYIIEWQNWMQDCHCKYLGLDNSEYEDMILGRMMHNLEVVPEISEDEVIDCKPEKIIICGQIP